LIIDGCRCHDGVMTTIGILHPGQMGVTIAAAANVSAVWAGNGRSPASVDRAASAGMTDAGDVATLCEQSDVVVSICPPAAAIEVANEVAACGFDGIYVDANAISPMTSMAIGAKFSRYVDGGVIGPPALSPGTTRLYLAGPDAADLVELWAGGPLDVRAISDSAETGAASALKMAYAGWTKGQSALLLAINALAEASGVREVLREEWDISQPGLGERSERVAPAVSRKAWRFAGEMAEIADTMSEVGLPPEFHRGAENLYERLAGFKDGPEPTLDDVLAALAADKA
jgi:3-hydroxyisobutyrate dehydrogenase-like beta-hydroxyacid dehydrogenase